MMRGEYERDVCTRAEAGVRVSFIEASIGAWKPKVAECHENVDHWVKHHPECTAVRGWLAYASYDPMISVIRRTLWCVGQTETYSTLHRRLIPSISAAGSSSMSATSRPSSK